MKLEREEERGRTKTKTETETNTKKQIQKTNTNTRDKQTNTVIQWPEVSSRVRIWRESSDNQTWLATRVYDAHLHNRVFPALCSIDGRFASFTSFCRCRKFH